MCSRGLEPNVSKLSLRVHDHGTPDKDFFELEGYLSCQARGDMVIGARMANLEAQNLPKASETAAGPAIPRGL